MVFRVVTLGVVVRKQKISSFNIFQEYGHTLLIMGKLLNMHNLSYNIGKVDYLYFLRKFFRCCQTSHLFKHNSRILHNRACKPADI